MGTVEYAVEPTIFYDRSPKGNSQADIAEWWCERERQLPVYLDGPFYRLIHPIQGWVGKRILDLGFGNGKNLFEFTRWDAETYGIDIDPKVINFAEKIRRETGYPITRCGDIALIADIFGITFHLIYSINTFVYLSEEKIEQCLSKIRQILIPTGRFVFDVIKGDYVSKNGEWTFDAESVSRHNPIIYRNKDWYKSAIIRSGLKIFAEKCVDETYAADCSTIRRKHFFGCTVE